MRSLFVSLAILSLVSLNSFAQLPTQADHDWVLKHFTKVIEERFPLTDIPGTSLAHRSYKDLSSDELEYGFILSGTVQENRISAVFRIADGRSLYSQLMTLHQKNRNADIGSIKKMLKIRELRTTQETCPEIRRLYEEFYQIPLKMQSELDDLTITLHPRVHTIRADFNGGSLELRLFDDEHPLVRWAERTKRVLETCASAPSKR